MRVPRHPRTPRLIPSTTSVIPSAARNLPPSLHRKGARGMPVGAGFKPAPVIPAHPNPHCVKFTNTPPAMSSKLNRDDVLDLLRQHKPIMKERFGVSEISLYGSFARDEATEDSDIDVVVKFGVKPTFRSYFGAQIYLEDVFGRSVDLARKHELRKEILPYVDRDLINV